MRACVVRAISVRIKHQEGTFNAEVIVGVIIETHDIRPLSAVSGNAISHHAGPRSSPLRGLFSVCCVIDWYVRTW